MKRLPLWITITGAILMTMMTANGAATKSGSITKSSFGKTPDGEPVDLSLLKNKNGVEVAITTYGGAVVSLKVSYRNRKLRHVVPRYDSLADYDNYTAYTGALVGRNANA